MRLGLGEAIQRGGRDSKPCEERDAEPGKTLVLASPTPPESPRLETVRDEPQRVETVRGAEAEIEAAIARLTRALSSADDDAITEIVRERRALREELAALRQAKAPGNVVPIRRGH